MIGSNLVAVIDGGGDCSNFKEENPCTILPNRHRHRSLLLSSMAQSEEALYAVLSGPSQSGRSSILMDAAADIASRTPCHCPKWTSSSYCQNCIAVSVVVLSSVTTDTHGIPTDETTEFPLFCYEREKEGNVSNSKHSGISLSNDLLILLPRIQVHHVTSAQDLLSYLYTIQAKPSSEQPIGGIIIDDVDRIVGGNSSGLLDHVTLARVSMIVAVALDTATFLNRRLGHSTLQPTVLVSLTSSPSSSKPVSDYAPNLTNSVDGSFIPMRKNLLGPRLAVGTSALQYIDVGSGLSSTSSGIQVTPHKWYLHKRVFSLDRKSSQQHVIAEYSIEQSIDGAQLLWDACLS